MIILGLLPFLCVGLLLEIVIGVRLLCTSDANLLRRTCQDVPGRGCSVVICVNLLRTLASAGSGNRVDLSAPRARCLRVTFTTAPSRTGH